MPVFPLVASTIVVLPGVCSFVARCDQPVAVIDFGGPLRAP